jgi:hypothetical protein
MNTRELNEWLRLAEPPVRSDAARREFVDSVLQRVRRGEGLPRAARVDPSRRWAWIWVPAAIGLLGLIVLPGVAHLLHPPRPPVSRAASTTLWRELARTFPQRLLAVITELGDTRLILSETPTPATGDLVCVRLSGGPHPCTLLTRSGASVEVGGLRFDVLADSSAQVWLIGETAVWSSAEPSRRFADLTVEACRLEGVL